MGDKTGIEWTDATWNPVSGCSKVSQGCKNCYAERVFPRVYGREEVLLSGSSAPAPATRPRRFTDIALHPDRLDQPLRWRKPKRIFVNSMSDLFHEHVPDEFIDRVFAVMALAQQHTFQILTKRPERMRRHLSDMHRAARISDYIDDEWRDNRRGEPIVTLPLRNVWIGVSVENQETADERIPMLLQTPAAVRFVSAEPLLGAIDLDPLWLRPSPSSAAQSGRTSLDWIIVGGESGPDARMFRVQWARSIVRQCRAVSVPVFVKQMGSYVVDRNDAGFGEEDVPTAWPIRPDGCDPVIEYDIHGYRQHYQGADCRIRLMDRKGADPAEWPEDLRVREFPRAVGEEFRAALAGTAASPSGMRASCPSSRSPGSSASSRSTTSRRCG